MPGRNLNNIANTTRLAANHLLYIQRLADAQVLMLTGVVDS
jgi:hypothetical protein